MLPRQALWRDWETGVYSGNGPEVPEPLFLVIKLNAIHLGKKCRAGALGQAEQRIVREVCEGPFVFNLCRMHMQMSIVFPLGDRVDSFCLDVKISSNAP